MNNSYIEENDRERKRLIDLVNRITDRELSKQVYVEGWTVAVVFAHLAFWDERRIWLLRRWKKDGVRQSAYDDYITDMMNDSLLPFFLALEPRKAANMAVSIAEELDREIAGLSPKMVKAIEALGDPHALDRSIHRKLHLDEIDKLLAKEK